MMLPTPVSSILLFFHSWWVSSLMVVREFRMMLILHCFFYPAAHSFTVSKWSDCHWRNEKDANPCLSLPTALLFIGGE